MPVASFVWYTCVDSVEVIGVVELLFKLVVLDQRDEMSAAAVKSEVMKLIPELSESQLFDVCTGLNLKLSSKPKKDKKSALYNLLSRYITSEEIEDEEESEQLAIFEKLRDNVQDLLLPDLDEKDDEEMKEKLRLEADMLAKLEELKEVAGKSIGGGVKFGKLQQTF